MARHRAADRSAIPPRSSRLGGPLRVRRPAQRRRKAPERGRHQGAVGRFYEEYSVSWLGFLRRPRWLLFLLAICGLAAAGVVPGWSWYHYRAAEREMNRFHHEQALTHLQKYL